MHPRRTTSKDAHLRLSPTDKKPPAFGIWSAVGDQHDEIGGRFMTTSLNLLTLQVYYRHPRVAPPVKE